jgi:GEVED domain/Fibronectin type III domain/Secretion system C-terminal sorting domain
MEKILTIILFSALLLFANNSHAQCDAPVNLQSSYSSNVSSFSWDPVVGATDYLFEIDWAGGAWGFGEQMVVSSSPLDIADLMQGGNFQWSVTAICANGSSVYTTALFSTPCVQPQNLSTTNITHNSAVLNWEDVPGINNANTGFSISYRLANTSNSWIQLTNIYSNPTDLFFNLSGLTGNTAYEWRVKRVCSSCDSDYLISQFVTLPSPCDAPVNLQSSYSNNISTFSWDPVVGALNYGVQLRWFAGNTAWSTTAQDIAVSNSPYTLAGLMQGGNYQWRVRANCGNGTSNYTVGTFSTPCVQPQNLSTTNITHNSAVLNWEHVPGINNGNTGFSISYRLANTNNTWIQLTDIYNNPTALFFNLTGLAANTAYEWRVRRVCSSSNSDYLISQFVTQPNYCISNGNTTHNWINYFKLGTIDRTSGAEPGGYANIPMSTDLVIGSTNNAGQIRAGFSGSVSNSRFMIWIDFNRNGSFSDAGERLILSNGAASISGTNIKNFAINIPSTATTGSTRMRVFHIRNSGNVSNPCLTAYFGETEDYTVNLVTSLGTANMNSALSDNENEDKIVALSVSPNPSAGLFNITVPDYFEASSYVVFTTTGKAVQNDVINEKGTFRIDLSNQLNGLYILTLFDENGHKQTTKLLLQNTH